MISRQITTTRWGKRISGLWTTGSAADLRRKIGRVTDSDDYFDNVLYFADPAGRHVEPTPTLWWQAWWQRTAATWTASADPLRRRAASQGFVLTTEQVRTAEVSRARARWLVARGRWQAPCTGVVSPLDIRCDTP